MLEIGDQIVTLGVTEGSVKAIRSVFFKAIAMRTKQQPKKAAINKHRKKALQLRNTKAAVVFVVVDSQPRRERCVCVIERCVCVIGVGVGEARSCAI